MVASTAIDDLIATSLAGDVYADLELLLPTVADKKNLVEAYEVVSPRA